MKTLAVVQAPLPIGNVVEAIPERFRRLTTDGIDADVVENPVIKMLVEESPALASGRRCSIVPEDEWLIFLD